MHGLDTWTVGGAAVAMDQSWLFNRNIDDNRCARDWISADVSSPPARDDEIAGPSATWGMVFPHLNCVCANPPCPPHKKSYQTYGGTIQKHRKRETLGLVRFLCHTARTSETDLLEKSVVAELVKKFLPFYATPEFIAMFARGQRWFLFSAKWIEFTFSISLRLILTTCSYLYLVLLICQFTSGFTVKYLGTFLSYACYVSRPSHTPWLVVVMYLTRNTGYDAPRYAICSILLSLHPS
jgi:hypothetical protein